MARFLPLLLWALAASAVAEPIYEVGAGDIIHIVVLGQPEMTGDFTVDRGGMITLPFLGRVKAADMSLRDLERKLTTLLADGYLKKPQVSVSTKEAHSLQVFVTGEVKKPGAYALRPDSSLRMLLADIGDLGPDVGHQVIVIRPPAPVPPEPSPSPTANPTDTPAAPGPASSPSPSPTPSPSPSVSVAPLPGEVPGAEIFRVNLRELQSGNPSKDFQLRPGDNVYFPKAAQIYVIGHAARPGAFRFEEGMTVYKALAMAGGVTEKGSSKARIVRLVDGKRKELKAKPTDILEPEDTVVVPERFF